MVTVTTGPSERSGIEDAGMSRIYQNVINLAVRLSLRRGPAVFMNAAMRENGTFDSSNSILILFLQLSPLISNVTHFSCLT
jgi:hypothetical protein